MDDIYHNDLPSSDEMSLIVRQILLHSSSSSFNPHNEPSLPPPPSFGALSETEHDEFDCESEEGVEAVVDEETVKRGPRRGSSKRSRAAEVHNLSEKRRRSRINEKMKALQYLIPNSNKTDKASMLDEAIEYLKQLQLQVQMLSLRNGVSLHPMCLPESFPPDQLSRKMDISGSISPRQESSDQTMFGLPSQCNPPNHLPPSKISGAVNSDALSGVDSSLRGYFGSCLLHTPSQRIITHLPDRKLPELSFPFKTEASNLMERDRYDEVPVKNTGQKLGHFPELNR